MDIIRGHRLTDEEANEMLWREIDNAYRVLTPEEEKLIEPLSVEPLDDSKFIYKILHKEEK